MSLTTRPAGAPLRVQRVKMAMPEMKAPTASRSQGSTVRQNFVHERNGGAEEIQWMTFWDVYRVSQALQLSDKVG